MQAAFMLLFAAAAAPDWNTCVPARWPGSDPASLALLDNSPINCLLVEQNRATAAFVKSARDRGRKVLAIVGGEFEPSGDFDALVIEEATTSEAAARKARDSGKAVIELVSRVRMNFEAAPVVGASDGVWPGIRLEQDGKAVGAPTGAPWIDTNGGFLRFARARSAAPVWISVKPPENRALSANNYVQAIADAAIAGAHWVISLDSRTAKELLAGEPAAREIWTRMNRALRFFDEQRPFWDAPDYSSLSVLQDVPSGALYAGGFIDMIAAKHIPASPLPVPKLGATPARGTKLLLNIDPGALSPEQQEKVRAVARQGAIVVNGPPAWKAAVSATDRFTFEGDQIKKLDEAWREINHLIGRRNFGVRLFGAPGMLSNLKSAHGGKQLALLLVNYTDYPVESISVHLLAKYKSAVLITPAGRKKLELYDVEEGSGTDLDRVDDLAIVVFEN